MTKRKSLNDRIYGYEFSPKERAILFLDREYADTVDAQAMNLMADL